MTSVATDALADALTAYAGRFHAAVGMPVETLRKIESGRVPTPAFFTVAALAVELRLPLDALVGACEVDRSRTA